MKDYEKVLTRDRVGKDSSESFWNQKAETYYASQKKGNKDLTNRVIHFLNGLGLIKNKRILDIGGGTGRYAIPLANLAEKVTIADVSKEMMLYAKDYQKQEHVYNVFYYPFDWDHDDLKD